MTSEPEDAQAMADLMSDLFCACRDRVQDDIGRLSGELFRQVDVEGRSLQSAADAAELSPGDARAALYLFRLRMAGALVESVVTSPWPGPDRVPRVER